MTEIGSEWRVIDGLPTAWFETSSLTEAAEFAGRVTELSSSALVDVRATGARVRLDSGGQAPAVSGAARQLGLRANPAVLQELSVVIETMNPTDVARFWQGMLGYAPPDDAGLVDPLRRDPAIRIGRLSEPRPLRNRIHLDVVRPAAVVALARPGEPAGPYGVCHADADGNEVDLVPGDPLGDDAGTSDWQAVFSAQACYRTASPLRQRDLVAAAAARADDAGFPLMIDLRPGLVIIDSGKDQWERDAHGLGIDFTDLAADIQTAARNLGAVADVAAARFVQLFLDAADVAAGRAFWVATLGYVTDPRPGVSDIYDPRRLGPVLVFQDLDASDTERRRQPNRIHVELTVPADIVPARLASAVEAGGQILDQSGDRASVADPEGNVVVIVPTPS